jgi:VanZ family protein
MVDERTLEQASDPRAGFGPHFRWLIWWIFAIVWSAALLRPEPVHAAEVTFPEEGVRYVAGKTLHVGAYAVLAVLSSWLPITRPWRWLLLVVLSAHAMGTEFIQQFVPERTGSWRDVGFDHIGLILGVLVSWKWWLRP